MGSRNGAAKVFEYLLTCKSVKAFRRLRPSRWSDRDDRDKVRRGRTGKGMRMTGHVARTVGYRMKFRYSLSAGPGRAQH